LHNPEYDHFHVSSPFVEITNQQVLWSAKSASSDYPYKTLPFTNDDIDDCSMYTLSMYASKETEEQFVTSGPIIITISAVLVFAIMIITFVLYDRWMERRQQILARKAIQSSAIVSSLFPKVVRDRLLNPTGSPDDGPLAVDSSLHGVHPHHVPSTKLRLKSFLHSGGNLLEEMSDVMNTEGQSTNSGRNMSIYNGLTSAQASQPIADLFLETTVMFADIAGFTAWCSVREPPQVFILLESIYGEFDSLAKRRNVFKVETIGDSYVAVTGLPEPRTDHGTEILRFFFRQICLCTRMFA
jgi:Adenylate and Guanylate cyclase catalytic domain